MGDGEPRPFPRAVPGHVASGSRHIVIGSPGYRSREELHKNECCQCQKGLPPHVCPPPLRTKSDSTTGSSGRPSTSLHPQPLERQSDDADSDRSGGTRAIPWPDDAELTSPPHPRSPCLVAGLCSRIGERLPRDGNKLPVETRRVQSQLEHAEIGVIADHAVWGLGKGRGCPRPCRR